MGEELLWSPLAISAPQPPATLNGTATAIGRTLIAIVENRQDSGGAVSIPAALVEHGAPERLG